MPKKGEVDEVWDALTACFGEVRTKSERGRRNKAVEELREAQATPQEIKIAYDYCSRNFTSFTEVALCNWLSRSLHDHQQTGSRSTFIRLLERKQ